ncbi:flagellar biosynthesis protein [Paenibacillus psychroresistens]|uniref:Flagellar biosynthesis protein n=1 Tax=Paenibacillus psychroresistens TaxID=1778678 RepID=A0A6B8RL45_9BACL|nr:TIGR02530 family flagellar biosynthesis protein [Paenibacillus psychroresistens]QGQ96235.1 flagellar biosynthesis protein [Paenibacillus psychroresistens]
MTEKISIGQLYPTTVTPASLRQPKANLNKALQNGQSFDQIFKDKMVRFSHHAEQRLEQRGIQLQPEQLAKIESAIDKAAAKGAKDSLILFKDMAFIVNVKNRTIVTALDSASMQDNVFTQIDSAVVIT